MWFSVVKEFFLMFSLYTICYTCSHAWKIYSDGKRSVFFKNDYTIFIAFRNVCCKKSLLSLRN